MIKGTVWAEHQAITKEKISSMVQDDDILKGWGEAAPQGIIDSRVDTSGMWGGGSTTIMNATIWVPLPSRIIKWSFASFINYNGATTGQQVKISFWIDGTQVYEQWQDSIGLTSWGGNSMHHEPNVFVVPNIAIGSHSFQVKGDFAPAVAGTNISYESIIVDAGKNIASQ